MAEAVGGEAAERLSESVDWLAGGLIVERWIGAAIDGRLVETAARRRIGVGRAFAERGAGPEAAADTSAWPPVADESLVEPAACEPELLKPATEAGL
ncbi:hypothetical protein [Catenulispora rubra]|uniref:hypothetical protein n=1 Tax=Catenulispora rubra TaxID=280293 RepID=UPI0018921B74|nr:hypothetical protein [Catenulispora rubra]